MLAACASGPQIDYNKKPPAGWPELTVLVIRQDIRQIQRTCRNPFWPDYPIYACARADFREGVCRIFTSTDDPDTMKHERAHCEGYDHVGETSMRDDFIHFKGGPSR